MFVDYFMLIVFLIYTIYMLWMRVLFRIIVWITRNVTDFLHVTNTIKRFPTHFQGHYQAQENDLVFYKMFFFFFFPLLEMIPFQKTISNKTNGFMFVLPTKNNSHESVS